MNKLKLDTLWQDHRQPIVSTIIIAVLFYFVSFYGKTIQQYLVLSVACPKHSEFYANTVLLLLILSLALASYCFPLFRKRSKMNKRFQEFWNHFPQCYEKLTKMPNDDFEKMIFDAKKEQQEETKKQIIEMLEKERNNNLSGL